VIVFKTPYAATNSAAADPGIRLEFYDEGSDKKSKENRMDVPNTRASDRANRGESVDTKNRGVKTYDVSTKTYCGRLQRSFAPQPSALGDTDDNNGPGDL